MIEFLNSEAFPWASNSGIAWGFLIAAAILYFLDISEELAVVAALFAAFFFFLPYITWGLVIIAFASVILYGIWKGFNKFCDSRVEVERLKNKRLSKKGKKD